MRRLKAFTLVELLVVIGIIALLISILLPTLNKAREQAARVKCQSNMRTLMQAVHIYASDSKNQLPFCNWDDTVDVTNRYYFGWLFTSPYGPGGQRLGLGGGLDGAWGSTPPMDGVKTGVLWPYVSNTGVYHCPMDTSSGNEPWTGTHWMTSYTMNGVECGYGRWGRGDLFPSTMNNPGLKITQFRRNAECVLMWELEDVSWNDGASAPNQGTIASRHYQGANVAFLDGHVEWWDPLTFNNLANDPTNSWNSLWCYPLTSSGR
jgi:prepilin-type processing-associated H-X9-DG protein/prepilin-type N-terminal cleavage/methylation domain-containing protein